MTRFNSKLLLIFSLLFATINVQVHAMEEQPNNTEEPASETLEQRQEAARLRWEARQEKARIILDRAKEAKKAYEQTMQRQKMIEAGNAADACIERCDRVLDETEKQLQEAKILLERERLAEEQAQEAAYPKTPHQSFVIPVESLENAFARDPELEDALNAFYNTNATTSDEQLLVNAFGPETGLTVPAAVELPESPGTVRVPSQLPAVAAAMADRQGERIDPTPLAPRVDPAPVEAPLVEPLPIPIDPVRDPSQLPAAAEAMADRQGERTNQPQIPAHRQDIDESFLADILKNISEHKVPMLTGGTLGLVHYLYENEVFNNAVAVRSPKMKEYMHDYVLPTAREALAAHFIQLIIPYLPYLKEKQIRSYSTGTYLASFVITKMLGTTALYLAKMVTETEHGQKLVTHYKRLPKRTKETIAKVLPWLDFARNLLMARSLASYFEPVPA